MQRWGKPEGQKWSEKEGIKRGSKRAEKSRLYTVTCVQEAVQGSTPTFPLG